MIKQSIENKERVQLRAGRILLTRKRLIMIFVAFLLLTSQVASVSPRQKGKKDKDDDKKSPSHRIDQALIAAAEKAIKLTGAS